MTVTIVTDPSNRFVPFRVVCNKCQCTLNVGELNDVVSRMQGPAKILRVECPKCENRVVVPAGMDGYGLLWALVQDRGEWRGGFFFFGFLICYVKILQKNN